MYAERDTGTAEALRTVGETVGDLNVLHGGKRIQFFGQPSWDYREIAYQNGTWQEVSDPDMVWPGTAGGSGAWNSMYAYSHDADSVAMVSAVQEGNGVEITVSVRGAAWGSTPQPLATWTIPVATGGESCAEREAKWRYPDQEDPDHRNDPPIFLGYECIKQLAEGTAERAFARVVYTPPGDRVIVTVNRTRAETVSNFGVVALSVVQAHRRVGQPFVPERDLCRVRHRCLGLRHPNSCRAAAATRVGAGQPDLLAGRERVGHGARHRRRARGVVVGL
jgi:hypothetical protein